MDGRVLTLPTLSLLSEAIPLGATLPPFPPISATQSGLRGELIPLPAKGGGDNLANFSPFVFAVFAAIFAISTGTGESFSPSPSHGEGLGVRSYSALCEARGEV
jgi:hypothetical protein